MACPAKRKTSAPRTLLTVLKACYLILFVISAIIVALFILYKVTIRPPEVNNTEQVIVPIDPDVPADPDSTVPAPSVTTIDLTRKKDFYTFLLLGTDDGNGNADTIMVGAFDLNNNKVSVISIPRDTLVDVTRRVKKINGAYGIGGAEQLLDELKSILGFRPDHYITVDIQAFVDVVNLLGGVDFYVPEDMYHNDGAGFIIDLQEGQQHLDGKKALQLVRYRGYEDQSADLGRIRTQQKFIRQLAKQVLSWSSVSNINGFAKIFSEHFDTDLSITELAYFGIEALDLDFSSDVTFTTLPGRGDASYLGINWYYELNESETLSIINNTVNPYTTNITSAMTNIFQVS